MYKCRILSTKIAMPAGIVKNDGSADSLFLTLRSSAPFMASNIEIYPETSTIFEV